MSFRSQAQRTKLAELVKEGKVSKATFDEWQRATGNKKLPERVTPKSATKIRKVKTL